MAGIRRPEIVLPLIVALALPPWITVALILAVAVLLPSRDAGTAPRRAKQERADQRPPRPKGYLQVA